METALSNSSSIPLKFQSLNRRWKEVLYAMSGFGPNLLMIIMGARLLEAFTGSGYATNLDLGLIWTIGNNGDPGSGASVWSIVIPSVFTILLLIGKAFDGIIDVPLANLSDSFKSKWGRRRPLILMCLLPMIVSFVCVWLPLFPNADFNVAADQIYTIWNMVWSFVWSLIFFTSYTLCLIVFYGSLSTVCTDDAQRTRVSIYKSIFDTLGYAIGYALLGVVVGAIIKGSDYTIRFNVIMAATAPLILTMLIPLFVIKEGRKHEAQMLAEGVQFTPLDEDKPVKLWASIRTTVKNKSFMKWLAVNCCAFFGLSMFLVAMPVLVGPVMDIANADSGLPATILNTCAFAPVPLMLFVYRKVIKKKGPRFAFQTSLIAFAISIFSFVFGSAYFWGGQNGVSGLWGNSDLPKYIIGCLGGIIGSYSIGSFFMMPYMIPSQIAASEIKLTNKNNASMYFASQALTTGIVGAIASYGVYGNINGLLLNITSGELLNKNTQSITDAQTFGTIPIGVYLVPIIVSIMCLVGFGIAFSMPKRYNIKTVAKDLKMEDQLTPEELKEYQEEDVYSQGLVGNIFIWFLSVGMFEFFWRYSLINKLFKLNNKTLRIVLYLVSMILVPIGLYGYITYKMLKEVDSYGFRLKTPLRILAIVTASLGLSFISNALVQYAFSKTRIIAEETIVEKELT